MAGITRLEVEAAQTVQFLNAMADRLDRWAKDSKAGGWSTHQVTPNEEAANECRRRAAELRAGLLGEA